MASGQKVFLQDKNGQDLLVASDWSMVQNRPTNLATTDQLPKANGWQRDGITYMNGGYDFDHVNNGWNCAYRIADLGSFKMVEIRLAFAVNHDIVQEEKVISLPQVTRSDGNQEIWTATSTRGVMIHFNGSQIGVYCQQFNQGDKYTGGGLLTFHTMYMSSL